MGKPRHVTKNIQLRNTFDPELKIHIELSYHDCGLADVLVEAIHLTIEANAGDGWEIEEEIDLKVNDD